VCVYGLLSTDSGDHSADLGKRYCQSFDHSAACRLHIPVCSHCDLSSPTDIDKLTEWDSLTSEWDWTSPSPTVLVSPLLPAVRRVRIALPGATCLRRWRGDCHYPGTISTSLPVLIATHSCVVCLPRVRILPRIVHSHSLAHVLPRLPRSPAHAFPPSLFSSARIHTPLVLHSLGATHRHTHTYTSSSSFSTPRPSP
jgi:hypothetical protein